MDARPSIDPALSSFLRHGNAASASASPISSALSSAASSSLLAEGAEANLLTALQQTLRHIQSSPGALFHTRQQLLPFLATSAHAFSSLWRQAFESKAVEPSGFSHSEAVQIKVHLALTSARLLRNLVVGDNQTQVVVFHSLCGETLNLLRLGSSLAFSTDPELQPLARSLIQLLSNVVTMNKPLQKALFVRLSLVKPQSNEPSEQRQQNDRVSMEKVAVLQNLLGSPDAGIVEAVQILLLNCIKSSATNSSGLATSAGGRCLLGQLLMLLEAAVEDEGAHGVDEDEDDDFAALNGGRDDDDDFGIGDLDVGDDDEEEQGRYDRRSGQPPHKSPSKNRQTKAPLKSSNEQVTVTVGHAIFAHLFEIGLFRHIYRNLASRDEHLMPSADDTNLPIVTTEQTLLLKAVDAWINAGGQHHPMHAVSSIDQFGVLLDEIRRLSHFVRAAISSSEPSVMADRRLPSAYKALVLVLENLIQLGVIGCEGVERDEQFKEESEGILRRMRTDDFVDDIVELLRRVTGYQPAISPFANTGTSSDVQLPPGHAHTSTGIASSSVSGGGSGGDGFRLEHLARVVIQLMGVLVFQHSPSSLPPSFKERPQWENKDEAVQVRAVQDRVREQQGLPLVLGATHLDEANPYIREHAIFTLRYLLQGNDDNQNLIRQLRPLDESELSAA